MYAVPILVAHNQSTVPVALPYILPWCNPVQWSPAELLALSLIIDTTPSNYHCYQQPQSVTQSPLHALYTCDSTVTRGHGGSVVME